MAPGQLYLFQHGSDFFEVAARATTEQSVRTLAAPEAGGRFGAALAVSPRAQAAAAAPA